MAIISIIIHYFLIQKYKKLAFEPVKSKERMMELNETTNRYEYIRWPLNWAAPIICFVILIGTIYGY